MVNHLAVTTSIKTNHGDLFPRVYENKLPKQAAGETMLDVRLYRFTRAIMSLTAIAGGVTGIADGARLARRERTRADSLRYCYPPASFSRADAGARPMSPR
jgi:hypothetical protein